MSASSGHGPSSLVASRARAGTGVETPRMWDECRTFLEVTRSKSFSSAAEALNMGTATVSRSVKRLEDLTGSTLVASSSQGIELTAEGALLAERLLAAEREIKKALFSINRDSRSGQRLVRLAITEGLSSFWLLPSFGTDFAPPDYLNFDFVHPAQPLRPAAGSVDITVGFTPNRDPSYTQVPLGFLHFLPLASRAYLASFDVTDPALASRVDFIQLNVDDGLEDLWPEWRERRAEGRLRMRFDGSIEAGFAARCGAGVALLGNYALLDPALTRVDWPVHYQSQLFATFQRSLINSSAVSDALEWIRRLLGPGNPWFGERLHEGQVASVYDAIPRRALELRA